jgi:hypothetical protein
MKRSASALLLLLPIVTGWLSISQARYGATLDDLRDQTYMQSTANADRSIGWLWSAPRSQTDSRGLGQSITWAWDPKLCDMILGSFKSDAFGIPMLGCESIKVAMHRAFMTWSQVRRAIYYFILVTPSLAATFVARFFLLQNHPMISFTEVTTLCEETGQLHEQCTHAEVWVTYRNVSRDGSTGGVSGAVQAAVALPTHAITTDFYHTNGQQPTMELSVSGTSIQVPKQTIEVRVWAAHIHINSPSRRQRLTPAPCRSTLFFSSQIVGGRIEFAYESPICWYLDSNFCNVFHRLKRLSDPTAVHATGAVILFTLWGFAAIAMVVEVLWAFRSQLKMRAKVRASKHGAYTCTEHPT